MSTKGASNRYGNTNGSKNGYGTKHIGYAWARDFNSSTLEEHFAKHGEQTNSQSKESYAAHAVKFANTVDRMNCVSYRDKRGTTYKYNLNDNSFAIVTKKGIVITYFKPKEGKAYFDSVIRKVKNNERK